MPQPRDFAEARMELRKIADEAEARGALAAVARSGKGLGAWARAHGIDGRSLHAWDLALKRRGKKAGRAKLIELIPSTTMVARARYVLRVGEVEFEFGDDAREETLRRVIGVLRSC